MTVPKIRVRRKTPKTRSGCATCRIRHIKCDETRPACRRCTSTQRICDGYTNNDVLQTQLVNRQNGTIRDVSEAWIYSIPFQKPWYQPLSSLSHAEGEAFTFFRQHTATQLQDGVQSQLWDRWAMQISHNEPAVLHAIIAVGAMHHARWDNPGGGFGTLQQIALTNYSKAVIELRSYISEQHEIERSGIVLLACILFVGFEMLQHEMSLAMQHLMLGLNIMTTMQAKENFARRTYSDAIVIKGSPTALMDELVPIFVRLDYGAPMFGRRHPMLHLAHDEYDLRHSLSVPPTFDSMPQAKTYLDLLSSGVFRLRGELMDIAEQYLQNQGYATKTDWSTCYGQALSRSIDLGPRGYQLLAQKQALEVGLAAFWRAMETLIASLNNATDRAIMAIQIQYILVFFTVTTCRDTSEIVCDGFEDLFENAIDLAEKYITSASGYAESTAKRNLSLEPGVIPTICLVANKCRQPIIRSKAIELLGIGCRREAMWDGRPFAAIMQKLSDLETLRAANECGVESSELLYNKTLEYPETARFCDVVIAEDFGNFGQGILYCARYRLESDAEIEIVEHNINFGEQPVGPFCTMKRAPP